MEDSLRQYKAFVDSLTPLAESYFKVEDLPDLDGPEGDAAKILLAKLDEEELRVINRLFRHLTGTGVYQTLEYLDRFIGAGELKLAWLGQELPLQPYGEDMASDWLEHCDGEPWPDETTCPVHRQLLRVEPVSIVYGLIRHSLEYYRASKELFPLANALIEGGCIIRSDKFQSRPYCEGCRKALARWAKETGLRSGLPSDEDTFFKRYGGFGEQDAAADGGRDAGSS